jgi:uncharacterized membrane protein
MVASSPLGRLSQNATGVVSTLVTGIWLAALFTDQSWWLAFMLFGYVVVVPLTALLFGDDSDIQEWWDADTTSPASDERRSAEADESLQTLRARYARGDLTDEQFERKVKRLLETETLEDIEAANDATDTATGHADREPERSR